MNLSTKYVPRHLRRKARVNRARRAVVWALNKFQRVNAQERLELTRGEENADVGVPAGD